MRFTYLLVLLVAFAVLHEAESGWVRRVWRRVKRWGKRKIKTWAIKKAALSLVGKKRDVSEFDVNKDGTIDVKELEHVLTTRDAQDFLQLADEDGNNEVTVDELKRVVRELSELK